MDKSEKFALGLSGLLLITFFIAIIYASVAKNIDVPTCITDVEPFTSDTLFQVGEDEYELHMIARMWAFQPSAVTLPVGSTLHMYVTSQDIIHGFKIENKNVNLMAVPNSINYMSVTFDEPGEYFFACHEFCGAAHHAMAGRINITEEDEVEATGGDL